MSVSEINYSTKIFEDAKEHPESAWVKLQQGIVSTHNQLLSTYSSLASVNWQPTPATLTFHTAFEFQQVARELGGEALVQKLETLDSSCFTTFDNPRIIRINLEGMNSEWELDLFLAEEMLHGHGLQKHLVIPEEHIDFPTRDMLGRAAMEKFVTCLAYNALGVLEKPLDNQPASMQGQIAHAQFINLVLEGVDKNLVVQACQTGEIEVLRQILDSYYGYLGELDGLSPFSQVVFLAALLELYEEYPIHSQASEEVKAKLDLLVPRFIDLS